MVGDRKAATELEWLKYFHSYADLGPAEGEVRAYMKCDFMEKTGMLMPKGYEMEEEE